MNLKQINEFRVSHGLTPLTPQIARADFKRNQNANRAARAQACRDLKAVRSSSKKK